MIIQISIGSYFFLIAHKNGNSFFCVALKQGIVNINKNGNSANLSRTFVMAKKIKELFASTLNGIPISIRCVSSMIVLFNA